MIFSTLELAVLATKIGVDEVRKFERISPVDNIGIVGINKYLSNMTAAMYSSMRLTPELLGQAIDNLGTKETIEEAKPVDRFAAVVQEMKDI